MRLVLPFPPTMNTYWRFTKTRVLISASGRIFRANAIAAVVEQLKQIPKPMTGPVQITLKLSPPDKRRRDLDNYLKAIFDSLTHAGVWEDDSQIKHMDIGWSDIVKGGAAEISIQPFMAIHE
ncbi:RusA family crossover junction endodeoxyribonuclease [Rosenbergiella sp. S61]|uniref:Crossover junction endodeoxyribonuclease rusA n=1 Tax=Rosenbergiella gaditana TaxID=2726987 RepID=A0ABS5SYZ3_9GAMM|nr:RusA family crossover junction endodeoxyribonuclease [Rosenbergiella gaditana]MBT0725127.1 RusA family crossover junction endodeoxyribonuclease [Rosenbergiella gaditana]